MEQIQSYWWCPNCKEEVAWHHVTFEGFHEDCGYPVEEKEIVYDPTQQVSRTDIFLTEYEKEQASNLLNQPILTDEEIAKAELISVNDMKRIIQEASASANKDMEEFTVIEMELARKYSHQQIAKAQHAKTARAIFDELEKSCPHKSPFMARSIGPIYPKQRECLICLDALKRRFTEEMNG